MERRLSKRTKSVFPITAKYEKLDYKASLSGETINISDGGACLVVDRPLPVNSNINLQFEIPSEYYFVIPDKIGNLETDAKIMWVDQHHQSNTYRCGVKFLNNETHAIYAVNEIIQTEEENLIKRNWKVSHPKISLPTVPVSHRLLEGLSPTSLSVDVTNTCNLRCKHCFWDCYDSQLAIGTNEDIINRVKLVLDKFPSITNITWYGGEPLLNRRTLAILEEGIKIKKNNLIITNGTMPIPNWHDSVHFAVSIDGTKEVHDKIRGIGVYDGIRHNTLIAIKHNIPINFLYCINALNIDCIPDFLSEWADMIRTRIVFTAYTPIIGKTKELILNNEQREKVVSLLMKMKAKYGEAIYNTELMIELIRAKYGKEMMENCPMNVFNNRGKSFCLHMCNDGSIRVPCAIGANANHLECRSVTKLALYAGKVLNDRKSFIALLKMYLSKPQGEEKIKVLSIGE